MLPKMKWLNQIELFEDKREKIKMKYWKEQHQHKSFMESTFQAYFEKVESPFQGKEFSRYVLAFAFNDEKLLYFGNGIQEIFGSDKSCHYPW